MDTIIFGSRKAVVVGASWDAKSRRAHIIYTDEKGKEHTTRAHGMSKYELRQAVLAELMRAAWPEKSR